MTTLNRRTFIKNVGALAAIGSLPVLALSQTAAWPATTKLTLPFPAGGAVDVLLRKLVDTLGPKLGTSMVVESKLGAAGLIAAKAVANGPADGSNIGYFAGTLMTLQAMSSRLDLLAEFKPVIKVGTTPHLIVVKSESQFKTQADLIAALKAQPGKFNVGSGGIGSPTHLFYEWLEEYAPGIKATHIPFKGATETVVGILQGEIDFGFVPPGVVLEQIKVGKLRALSVTSTTRMTILPNIPTVREAGVAGYTYEVWAGMFVPVKTPDDVVARLFEAVKSAASSPEYLAFNERVGARIELSNSPAEFTEQIRASLPLEKKMVVKLGLKSE